MKKLTITLALMLSYIGLAQEFSPVFEDTSFEGSMLKISSLNYYSSNRFNNDLMDKFIFGGEITSEIKDRASDRLNRLNTIGGEIEQKIDYYNGNITPLKNKNYGLVFSLSDNHFISSNMATDLFRTAMYGNADYLNDTMDFSFSNLQYLHFQKFGIGFFDKRTLSSVQINYVSGSKNVQGRLAESWMHSNQDSISLMLQGSGFQTDLFSPYWAFQGNGVSVDINYNFPFTTKNGNEQAINLKVSNLGLIAWNRASVNYSIDSTTIYKGFDIQNFINQPEGETNEYNFVDTLGLQTEKGTRITAMPVEFSLQKVPVRYSNKKLQYLVGFKAILTSDYFPYLFGGLYYSASDNFSASTRISYGGFGGLQWGLNLNYWIKERAYISLGSFNMIGNFSKNIGYGRSLNFSAHFKF